MTLTPTTSCILAAVVVLIVLVVAVLVVGRRRGPAGGRKGVFMPGDAATPKLREAVTLLGGDLACISRVADSVESGARRIERAYGSVDMGAAFNEARLSLTGARQGMVEIVRVVKRLRSTVGRMTPTYQNVLGLYSGLRDSDQPLWAAAKALDVAGERMQSLVSSTDDHDHTGQVHVYALKEALGGAATQLRQMSSCLYSLVRTIHYLGNALQLE
jgi:hypothetical protein